MAIRKVTIDKALNGVIAHLVRGDSRTQIIRLEIDRYDGGVDLAGLAWCIKVVNAAGASDVFPVDPVATDDQMLAIDWLVSGVATSVAGHTKVALEGASDADGEAVVWRSGVGLIHVREDLDAIPSEDDEQLTALQTLILHVRNELEGVVAAGQAAEKAAADADAVRVDVETAEAARATAEAERADAEAGRMAAEEQRASAEQNRRQEIDALQSRVEQAEIDVTVKLPTTPTDWPEWSADAQAVARNRIGIHAVTQAEYDALTDTSGIYIIVEAE